MIKQFFIVMIILSQVTLAFSEEESQSELEIIGKTHTIAAFQSFSGQGSTVISLPNTYDMSIFEFSLGGKQSLFNGSGITTNSNYPLSDGEAVTNNTHLGFSKMFSKEIKAGILGEFYTLGGDRTVGRVFGEELPWDDFPRDVNGAIQPHHVYADFYHAFLEGRHDQFSYKIVGGNLSPRELPELTRKESNQVKLGSLIFRAPISNTTFFEKGDRKIEEGRHPMRGFDVIGNYEYQDKKSVHWEIFGGGSQPTPISDIERDSYGGRVAMDVAEGNVGASYVYQQGQRHTSRIEENQGVWAVDSSYRLWDWLIPYLTFARTDYERETTMESHRGNAYVGGVLFKLPKKYEVKVQYQRLEENYDLIAVHKTEHYPGNTQGVNLQAVLPLTDTLKLKGSYYYLTQLETVTSSGDTLFGDSFFPSSANSQKGRIDIQRIGVEWKAAPQILVNNYIEHAGFNKKATTISTSIDKDVYNFYIGSTLAVTDKINLETGFRRFLSLGDWQTMAFESYQDVPEAALMYKFNQDSRAYLIYHYYNFEDHNAGSQGRNDYYGHQLILEVKVPL